MKLPKFGTITFTERPKTKFAAKSAREKPGIARIIFALANVLAILPIA